MLPVVQNLFKPRTSISLKEIKRLISVFKFNESNSESSVVKGTSYSRPQSNNLNIIPKSPFSQLNLLTRKSNLIFDKKFTTSNDQNDNANTRYNGDVKMNTKILADQFILALNPNEKLILKLALIEDEVNSKTGQISIPLTWKQIGTVCFSRGLPFIGFGFVDNFVMIVAGEMIETYIGFFLPISTMAAAGLGNAISDVFGIGLAHHIETFCLRVFHEPNVTAEQLNTKFASWCLVISKALSIFIGCIIGMFPLLFREDKKEKEKAISTKE